MKHYWINIDKNEKRQLFMSKQFEKLGLPNERVSAITPADFDKVLEQKRPLTCKYPGCITCEYEFACLCSHLKAMQQALKSDDDYFIIMEDDISMPFVIDYDLLVKNMPVDTEILQMMILFGKTVMGLYEYYKCTGTKYIPWQYLLPSTGMYLISRKGAQMLVDMFYNAENCKFDFTSSPHQIVADVLLYKTAKTYATTVPYCVPYIEMGSDIHPDHLQAHEVAIRDIKKVLNEHKNNPFPCVVAEVEYDV
jgi:GR25 family glycosyltransferase involved in LPS biosynthesis